MMVITKWFLGSMNDGLFIINQPPRPSTDDVWAERLDGPDMVLNVTELTLPKAQAVCDAHNTTADYVAGLERALSEYVVLGAGKCTISKAHADMGRAALAAKP